MITITSRLAKSIGQLASKHPNTSVTIAYHDDYPVEEWLVTFDIGWGSLTYVVNDETGAHRAAGMGEKA